MTTAAARRATLVAVRIPVIDIGPALAGASADAATRAAMARAIDEACSTIGFLAITGHGIDDRIVTAVHEAACAFFALPEAERMAVAMPEPGYPYGYNPFSAESLERSLGATALPDLKETFNVGPIDPPPRPPAEMDDPDEAAVYAPNLWPARPVGFRDAVEAYYRAMSDLAAAVMGGFAMALGLDQGWFDPLIDRHGSALRLAHYPALTPPTHTAGRFRAGAHTDYGTLTILWTDGRPGLEVLDAGGEWQPVEVPEGAFVVNLGDLMARWTNDRWRSTMHRVVVADPTEARVSIPFFHNANWDAVVECIVDPGEAPRHPPVTAGRHLMAKFRSTQQ